ncbi:hypothetical protein ALP57_200065 [Pseudomonas coronafaciens pv. oryzae]|nr:hypothetical protein ALP57_200065 [Pseudomonas coronafaciens pv. oryzae]
MLLSVLDDYAPFSPCERKRPGITPCVIKRLPLMRQQLIDFTRPLSRQPRENIFQICVRVMTL